MRAGAKAKVGKRIYEGSEQNRHIRLDHQLSTAQVQKRINHHLPRCMKGNVAASFNLNQWNAINDGCRCVCISPCSVDARVFDKPNFVRGFRCPGLRKKAHGLADGDIVRKA